MSPTLTPGTGLRLTSCVEAEEEGESRSVRGGAERQASRVV